MAVNIKVDLHQSESGPFVKHVDTLAPCSRGTGCISRRGVHLVEAFVSLKRNNTLVGQSEAFRVVIE
jgi:hypothetical protein